MSHPKETVANYLWVGFALFVLLGLTVWVYYLPLGVFDFWVSMAVAVVKTVLILLFFMHLRHSSPLTWSVALTGLFLLLVMGVLSGTDYFTRTPEGWRSQAPWTLESGR